MVNETISIGNSLRREVNFGNFERERDKGKCESRRGFTARGEEGGVFLPPDRAEEDHPEEASTFS